MGWWILSNKDMKMSVLFNLSHCFSFYGNHKNGCYCNCLKHIFVWKCSNKFASFLDMYHILYVSCLLIIITIVSIIVTIINIIANSFYHCMTNVVIIVATIIIITVIIANSSYLRKITVVRARSEARTVENIFSWILLLRFTIVMRMRRLISFLFCFEDYDCLAWANVSN